MNTKTKLAADFIRQIKATPIETLQAMIIKEVGEELSTFFDSYSTSLLNLSSPQTLSSNVRALMLMGYLIRCNEQSNYVVTAARA